MINRKLYLASIVFLLVATTLSAQSHKSLVPGKPSDVPDYFSTWNIQGYVVSYDGPATPRVMTEQYMFGDGTLEGWTRFFPDFREDLIFLMDDSWDIPVNDHRSEIMGEARLDKERFPSCNGNLRKLVHKTKRAGWKGLGGWICAQEASTAPDASNSEAYWTARLKENHRAGMAYWKVDFGRQENNQPWREELTRLGPVGVFGYYGSLKLYYDRLPSSGIHIWAQDLIGKHPIDITPEVQILGNTITLPGSLLERIGTQASTSGDESAPGLVLVVE